MLLRSSHIHATRTDHKVYRHEMALEQHEAFVAYLLEYPGMVIVSGYDHPLYRRLEAHGWERREFRSILYSYPITRASKRPRKEYRVEVVWSNPLCVESRKLKVRRLPFLPQF